MANLQVMQGITAGSTTSGGSSGVAFPLQVSSTDDYGVGTTRWNSDGTKRYKWVKLLNTGTTAGVAGDIAIYVATTGYSANTVSIDASADAGGVAYAIAAGVLTASVTGTAATAYYLWVQTDGDCTLSNAVSSGAVNKTIVATNVDKIAVLSANAYDPWFAVMYNTTTGVILKCVV